MPSCHSSCRTQSVAFNDFFELGLEESVSPFLTPQSRRWGINLDLKASLFAAFLLLISFVLSFFPQWLPFSHIALIGVYFFAGIPSLIESIDDLSRLEINIDVLMTLAAFSSILIGSGMEGGLLLVLFALSGSIEAAVTSKAKGAISNLHKLSPTKACVIDESGTVLEKAVNDVSLGAHILIKVGETVPLDGVVISGISSVNMVHLTGENLPVMKKPGDQVPAGANNLEGSLTLKVTNTSSNSTLARIIQLVTQAQEAKPKLQRWFDKVSERYATAIIALSLSFALSFPFLFEIPFLGVEGSVYRALAFLIAASPCALILAIPIAYLSAVSICAKQGILLKGGVTLDALASCSIIAFDKTGTLTTGQLSCYSIEKITFDGGISNASAQKSELLEALGVAAGLEGNVVHPIATAIISYAEAQGAPKVIIKDFKSVPGYGLSGKVKLTNHEKYLNAFIGRAEFIASQFDNEKGKLIKQKGEEIQKDGALLTLVSIEDRLYFLRFQDTLREKMGETISALKNRGRWKLLMLTGDHEYSARRVATELKLDEYYANLSPADKLEHVSKLSHDKGLAMIGDGVNDAPALARATVGISMGKVGSATAVEAADVVLLHDNLELLDWLMSKAHKTTVIVRQNLTVATAAILIAAFPALTGIVPLWLAVLMHEGGTILVGLNALRLLRR